MTAPEVPSRSTGTAAVPAQRRLEVVARRHADRGRAVLEQWLVVRAARRFVRIGGRDRALVMAGQAFTTIVPLLIVVASLAGSDDGAAVGDSLVRRFHLQDQSADAVRTLFLRPPGSTGTLTLAGVLLLLLSLVSFTRALQRTYEAAWDLPPAGLRGMVQGLTGTSLLLAQVIVLGLLAGLLRPLPASDVITPAVRVAVLVPLWLWLQHLLLSRRVSRQALLPGAVATAVGQLLLSLASTFWMPGLVASNAERYGVIGVTFAMLSWLIVLGFAVVASAVLSAEVAGRRQPA